MGCEVHGREKWDKPYCVLCEVEDLTARLAAKDESLSRLQVELAAEREQSAAWKSRCASIVAWLQEWIRYANKGKFDPSLGYRFVNDLEDRVLSGEMKPIIDCLNRRDADQRRKGARKGAAWALRDFARSHHGWWCGMAEAAESRADAIEAGKVEVPNEGHPD